MNDIDKQEQEPITPEQTEPTESTESAKSSQKTPKAPQKIAVLALILALSGLVLGYVKWGEFNAVLQQEKDALIDLNKRQQENKERLDKSDKAISAQKLAFATQEESLDQQAHEMKQSLDLVYERVGRSSTQWLVAESEYLMRIANHRLQLEGDSKTALVALERADKRLRDSGDPVWTPIREMLASEMAELKGLQELDLAGQTAKLSGLISQVEKLNLPHSLSTTSKGPDKSSKEKKEFSFDTILKDIWEGSKSLLVVRRHDRPVTAMLEPDQAFFLYQNLRLQLEGVRFALLRKDQHMFDEGLQAVETWIKEYFDQEQSITKSMLQEINQLKKLELESGRPDISGSLRMLLEQQGRGDEVPDTAEEQQPVEEEQKPTVEKAAPVVRDDNNIVTDQQPADDKTNKIEEGEKSVSEGQEDNGTDQKAVAEEQKETP
jgi:uroporphyrin-3 C-methyltransferase